jgi:hypothetical protein
MSCGIPIASFVGNPILIGFPWTGGLYFGTGEGDAFVAVDYSLYDIFFAISPSVGSSTTFAASSSTLAGLVTFAFTNTQTAQMTQGDWTGHTFLKLKAGGSPDYIAQVAISVIDPVPLP